VGAGRYACVSERDAFDQAGFVATMAAGAGDRDAVDGAVAHLLASPCATSGPADAAVVAVGVAARAVLAGDEACAVAAIDDVVTGAHAGSPLADAFLRRSPGVAYVCSPALRRRWDAADLGPSTAAACAVARLLVDARAGRSPRRPASLGAVATVLPLPWSVELAAWAVARRLPWGMPLAAELADRFGPRVAACLAALAGAGDARLRRGAVSLRRALPVRPATAVEVGVLGPLEVRRGGRRVDAPELRRARVRELLCLLVADRVLPRDRVVDLLWPDLAVADARANLRVTLTHLHRLLEPGRPAGQAPYLVRADGESVRLADVPGLVVDAWEAEADLARAAEAARRGDTAARAHHLGAALARWRDDPLPDLDRVPARAHHARHLGDRLAAAALDLGELELTVGSAASAAERAERALAADPYLERAHRLAVAAQLHLGDGAATRSAVARLGAALADIGAPPDPATAMLLHQADGRPGRGTHPGPRSPVGARLSS
jgi:DNA-binding SARP family transcriptional activator